MEKYNRLQRIFPYVAIAILGMLVFLVPFGSGDELWNYNFAKNVSLGKIPYKDFSMVQTPLSTIFPAILMALAGRGLFVFRVAGYILFVMIIALYYHICTLTCKESMLAATFTIFAAGLLFLVYAYDYNYLMIFLLLTDYELILRGTKKKKDLWMAMIAGCAVLAKQSTGAYVFFVHFVLSLVKAVKTKDYADFAKKMGISMIPFGVFGGYLLLTQSYKDFYEYAIYGVRTFTHRTTPVQLFQSNPVFGFFFALGVFWILFMLVNILLHKTDWTGVELFAYALAGMGVVYPLCDEIHVIAGILPVLPAFLYFKFSGNVSDWVRKVQICFCVIVGIVFGSAKIPAKEDFKYFQIHNYELIPMAEYYRDSLNVVDAYIAEKEREGYRVRIVEDSAAFYKIPLDEYEKNWDMLLIGNLGAAKIDDLLSCDQNCLYLVRDDVSVLSKQNYFELMKHVKDNYERVDEVAVFGVYKKTVE